MDPKRRLTDADLEHIRRVFPPENNYTIKALLDEIAALRAELRAKEAQEAAGEICRMSWEEVVRRLRRDDNG